MELARRNLAVAFQEANASRLSRIAAQRAAGYGLIVTDRIFDQLAMDDQAQLKSLYPSMKMVPISSVGKILSFQVLDKSTAGNNFGSSIGSALGQATYVDKSIARGSYSATGQLGAALIGAAIGSSLNKAPEQRFLISYGIQTFDGAIKAVVNSSPDGIAAPVGQCVHVPDVTEAEPYLCSDTLVGFLNRAGRLKQDDRELSKTEIGVRIRCKISSVATLMLSQSECSRLNGSPVTSGATQ